MHALKRSREPFIVINVRPTIEVSMPPIVLNCYLVIERVDRERGSVWTVWRNFDDQVVVIVAHLRSGERPPFRMCVKQPVGNVA